MNHINNDMVLWAVIVCVAGAAAVMCWLFWVAYRNATRDQDKK